MWQLLLACLALGLHGMAQAVSPHQQGSGQRANGSRQSASEEYDHHFEGFYGRSLWWLMNKRVNLEEPVCLATFIARHAAVTPCECVTNTDNLKKEFILTSDNHRAWSDYKKWQEPIFGGTLAIEDVSNLVLMEYYPRKEPEMKNVSVDYVKIHPGCGSLYTFNIALLRTTLEIPNLQLAWVVTSNDVLFTMALRRVIAGQAISGKCVAPYYSIRNGLWNVKKPDIMSIEVDFQNWDACHKLVCPNWNRGISLDDYNRARLSSEEPYSEDICIDRVAFTKYCVHFNKPFPESCQIIPGTPVYCEAGDISGFFGFLVRRTFARCPIENLQQENYIFQGLNRGIAWLREQVIQIPAPDHLEQLERDDFNPSWLYFADNKKGTKIQAEWRKKAVGQDRPQITPKPVDKLVETIFGDDVANTVVNYYYKGLRQGVATQIAPKKFILPCWAVTAFYERYVPKQKSFESTVNINEYTHPYTGSPEPMNADAISGSTNRRNPMDVGSMKVRRAVEDFTEHCVEACTEDPKQNKDRTIRLKNGRSLILPYCYCVQKVIVSKKCDSHYMDDFAVLVTIQDIEKSKTAFIQTSNPIYFKRAMDAFIHSSMISGECFLMHFNYTDTRTQRRVDTDEEITISSVEKHYIRVGFANWDFCRPIVCPLIWYRSSQTQDECWNAHMVVNRDNRWNAWMEPPVNASRICITSTYHKFMCNIVTYGTPVFCKSRTVRGLVGFVSKYHMAGCDPVRGPMKKLRSQGVHSAVMMRIDRFASLYALAGQSLISKFEKSSVGQQASSPFGVATVIVLDFLVHQQHFRV